MKTPLFKGDAAKGDLHPRTVAVFVVAGALGSLAVMPYVLSLYSRQANLWTTLSLALVSAGAAIVAMLLGLRWGLTLSLGAPRVQNWAWNRADPGGWGATLGWSVPIALVLSGIIYVAEEYWYAGAFSLMYADKTWWKDLGAALYAGTAEEMVLRLFAMTGAARLLLAAGVPRARAIVAAVFISGAISTAFHLPASLAFHPLSWPTVGHVFVHHGVAALIYGWLYWRRGIEAAMVAHGLCELLVRVWLG